MRRSIVLCLTLAVLVAAAPARAEGELIGSSLSIVGDQEIMVGDPVGVSGTLVVDSTCPGNQTVDLWRTLPGGEPELLSTRNVTVNCDTLSGPYDYVDVPAVAGEVVYQATWAGTDLHAPAQSELHVITVAKHGASLSIFGDQESMVGDPVGVSGTLFVDSTCPGNQTVDLWRTLPGGEPELLSTRNVTVNCDTLSGPYGYVDAPPVVGEIVYQATWAGTDVHAPAQSELHVITVAKQGASLSLTGDKQIEVGESTTLSAKLRGPDDGNVSFYRVDPDGAVLLAKKSVNPSGTASITVSPKARTRYVARYGGTAQYEAASDSLIVTVRVITTAKMVHHSYKADGYAIYDCCRAYYWFKVAPNHAGEQVTVQLQIFFEGKWRSYDPWYFKLRSTSAMEIFIDIDGGSGYRLRVKTCMPSHADHLGDCSPYAYFRYS